VGEDRTLLILLEKIDGFGMSNLCAYLPEYFQRLNGMNVIVEIEDNFISIIHDPDEKVYEINYTRGNSCKIPDDDVKTICKPGEKDCCIFLSMASGGFECQKFDSSTCRMLLDRHSKGTMRASRIGNCMIVGRIGD
jgi:hypothetical protein